MAFEYWGELAGLGGAFVVALEGIFVKGIGERLPTVVTNAARCTVAACFALTIDIATQGAAHIQIAGFAAILLSVIFSIIIGDTAYFLAIRSVGVGVATAIAKTFPVFTAIFAYILLGEPLGVLKMIGIATATCGTVLLSIRGTAPPIKGSSLISYRHGFLLALGSAIASGIGVVAIRDALHTWSVWDTGFSRMALGSVLLWPVALRSEPLPTLKRILLPRAALGVIAVGACLSVTTLLLIVSIQKIGAGPAAAYISMAPLFAVPLSVLLFRERVTTRTIAGVLLAVVGIILISLTPL